MAMHYILTFVVGCLCCSSTVNGSTNVSMCFKCGNATSNEVCNTEGQIEDCPHDEKGSNACSTEITVSSDRVRSITKKCLSSQLCTNKSNIYSEHCNLTNPHHPGSKCVFCCDTMDMCNDFYPMSMGAEMTESSTSVPGSGIQTTSSCYQAGRDYSTETNDEETFHLKCPPASWLYITAAVYGKIYKEEDLRCSHQSRPLHQMDYIMHATSFYWYGCHGKSECLMGLDWSTFLGLDLLTTQYTGNAYFQVYYNCIPSSFAVFMPQFKVFLPSVEKIQLDTATDETDSETESAEDTTDDHDISGLLFHAFTCEPLPIYNAIQISCPVQSFIKIKRFLYGKPKISTEKRCRFTQNINEPDHILDLTNAIRSICDDNSTCLLTPDWSHFARITKSHTYQGRLYLDVLYFCKSDIITTSSVPQTSSVRGSSSLVQTTSSIPSSSTSTRIETTSTAQAMSDSTIVVVKISTTAQESTTGEITSVQSTIDSVTSPKTDALTEITTESNPEMTSTLSTPFVTSDTVTEGNTTVAEAEPQNGCSEKQCDKSAANSQVNSITGQIAGVTIAGIVLVVFLWFMAVFVVYKWRRNRKRLKEIEDEKRPFGFENSTYGRADEVISGSDMNSSTDKIYDNGKTIETPSVHNDISGDNIYDASAIYSNHVIENLDYSKLHHRPTSSTETMAVPKDNNNDDQMSIHSAKKVEFQLEGEYAVIGPKEIAPKAPENKGESSTMIKSDASDDYERDITQLENSTPILHNEGNQSHAEEKPPLPPRIGEAAGSMEYEVQSNELNNCGSYECLTDTYPEEITADYEFVQNCHSISQHYSEVPLQTPEEAL